MRHYLLIVLALLIGGCDALSASCPDGQPPRTIPIFYTATVNGTATEATGHIGAETRTGDKTILTLQTAGGVRLEITLYRDPAAGEDYVVDMSASYESERDAGMWVHGKNADGSLVGSGSVNIADRSADGISGEFEVTYFNANQPGVTITATFEDAPLATC